MECQVRELDGQEIASVAGGGEFIWVSDVVIIDGQEAIMWQQMFRAPEFGQYRWMEIGDPVFGGFRSDLFGS